MALTKITESVIQRFSKWFNVNSTTGAVTSVVPDLIGSNTTLYPSFSCRAWVNFDGTRDSTGASNTNTTNRFIRGSGNVTSVLRNGTGDYTITFTTAMPDANYSITGICGNGSSSGSGFISVRGASNPSINNIPILLINANDITVDLSFVCLAVFR